jgi:hypothetical protein
VKWRNTIRIFQRQLKKAFLGAESIQHPAEWSASHVLGLIIECVLSLIAILLLFPFTWSSTLLDASAFISAVALSLIVIKAQTSSAFALRWWSVFTVTLLVAAACYL